MASQVPRKFASAFRRSGLNYIEALTVASNALRSVLKEPKRSQAVARATVSFRDTIWREGIEAEQFEYGIKKKEN
eukprot:CAMPEP_0197667210 /NCGR_PEP_ID=MMETSP1338-20131121/65466_1 /TAXON_ID=43686 ORGANISM="Pelagodinium beii, Strain RCC1491" /NCGR_SAMPLE_ID=MMETSP1338 /ASSEMBLY_ACC=CAM_ASM_000754 /LENGTH=74 /DNA_ID=CAMNT_0043246397 /DNA_START=89 /DNA_END=313 /DNA_ORIENTATION=+